MSGDVNPTDPKKIGAKIRRIERNFEKDPDYRDGGGGRFLLGPFYLLLGDLQGALEHYKWFEKKFPDSGDEPVDAMCWTLAMYRSNQETEAEFRLRRAYLANPYFIPALLGLPHGQPEVQRSSNWEHEEFVTETPPEFLNMWTPEERVWLKAKWQSSEFTSFVKTHIGLCQQLSGAEVGPHRSELVNQLFAMATRPSGKAKLKMVSDCSGWPDRCPARHNRPKHS
jgi:hypothetical protein